MDVLNELAAKAMSGFEKENLVSFMRAFCGNLAQAGEEIPERDRPFQEMFQKVYEAVLAVEEKTAKFKATENLSEDEREDARKRLWELRTNMDRLQTMAHSRNPALIPFTRKVALQAREMAKQLEQLAEEPLEGDLNKLYDQFKSIEEQS